MQIVDLSQDIYEHTPLDLFFGTAVCLDVTSSGSTG